MLHEFFLVKLQVVRLNLAFKDLNFQLFVTRFAMESTICLQICITLRCTMLYNGDDMRSSRLLTTTYTQHQNNQLVIIIIIAA